MKQIINFFKGPTTFYGMSSFVQLTMVTLLFLVACEKEDDPAQLSINTLKSTTTETDDGYVTYYQNELFVREVGKPVTIIRQIGGPQIVDYEGCFRLRVQSGVDGNDYVSAAIVKIDGVMVLGTTDFNNSNQSFKIDLCNLTETSVMELIIYGTPGSALEVWIEGKPANTGTFIDERDGKEYKWVRICDKIWMAENLAYLPTVSPSSEGSKTEPYYYVYGYQGNDVNEAKMTENFNTYGVLYNWAAAMQGEESSDDIPSGVQGISPAGWHLPSHSEWDEMLQCVGAGENPYFKLIIGGGTGFDARFAGIRGWDGLFYSLGLANYMWSSTNATEEWAYNSNVDNTVSIAYTDMAYKVSGFAIRCIKDQ